MARIISCLGNITQKKSKENKMIETIAQIGAAIPDWVAAVLAVMTAAKAITTLTPTKTDDEWLNKILRVLNVIALNVGKAKNADDK